MTAGGLDTPLVSVLLPVYNGADYLADALGSLLGQTWTDLELIVINDGSSDDSAAIIRSFHDPRIRYLEQPNAGLAATLNRCIGLARGRYLARQDQDDIALPERFDRQVQFLDRHPACGLVGTWAAIVEGDRETARTLCHPADNASLQFELLFDNPFVHSSLMIRKEVFDTVGPYSTDRTRQPPEDYELWSRVARRFQVANIPEVLQVYREVPHSMSRTGLNPFLDKVMQINRENIAHLSGRDPGDPLLADLVALAHGAHAPSGSSLADLGAFVHDLAQRLAAATDGQGALLHARADRLLATLRHRHLAQRYGRAVGALFRVAGKVAGRVVRS